MSSRRNSLVGRPGPPGWPADKSASQNDASSGARRRSNSQSQVVNTSFLGHEPPSAAGGALGDTKAKAAKAAKTAAGSRPQKRHQAEFYVTLSSLNDTFATKHVHVPYFPETCKLGRPTGTKVRPHVSNGYFDSRVLSRNHACMFVDPKTGRLMVRDMGSSNGTFVNSEKLAADAVPVGVGDVINLGFNIQVETNHKQISAKIEAVNVVSNNPRGAMSAVLPRLTKSAMGNFCESDMRHYEFLQGLCSQLAEKRPEEGTKGTQAPQGPHKGLDVGDSGREKAPDESEADDETDSKRKALRAFDYGMFSDIVPSMDELFEGSANQHEDAGIYANSGIHTAPELLSTLDYLGANLAKVKQQNTTLSSLEVFFSNYTKTVDEANASYLQAQTKKYEKEHELQRQQEKEKSVKIMQDNEAKLAAQARLVSTLETEIAQLKLDARKAALAQKHREESNKSDRTDDESGAENEFKFTPLDRTHSVSSDDHEEKVAGREKLQVLPNGGEQRERSEHSEARPLLLPGSMSPSPRPTEAERTSSNGCKEDALSASDPGISPPKLLPYLQRLHHSLAPYKTQGVVVGFFVVIAGLIYQNSKSV